MLEVQSIKQIAHKQNLSEFSLVLYLENRRERWKAAFDEMDTDRSGQLCAKEVRQLLEQSGYARCTEADIGNWIESNDKDGDQQVSYAEFVTFMEMCYSAQFS
ncbi:hypothetical protein EG68_01202 [Paragonimus skrjabini miyazakii]|uniref:EF-hand domain-containing protein n=1 Tax=Paragonimus skrjabini miyazakii TaxID=59628 RepID=A0A8S9ZBK8_9TREM|nr:hypothetical protein EG68_01202 [Paragonimus skrjabini miyazakii]